MREGAAKFLEQVRAVIEIHLVYEDFGVEALAGLVAHSRGTGTGG